jgi:hypothetical protein
MFKYSAIILGMIRRSFFTKSQTATMFISVRLECGGHPSHHIVPGPFHHETMNTTLKRLIGSEPHSRNPFAPVLVFLSQIDRD